MGPIDHARRSALAAAMLAGAALAPVSCADTGGALVPLTVAVDARGSTAPFTTTTGWEVTLDEAWVHAGPFRAYAGDLPMALRAPWRSVARAHGGTDPLDGRRIRAEWLEPVTFDALAPSRLALGTIDAETGPIDEVGILLEPLPSDEGETRGHQAWVAGTATREGASVTFAGGVSLETERRVTVPLSASLAAGGTWTVVVDPRPWLADAHFDRLPEPAEGPRPITPENQVRGAFFLGLTTQRAWSADYENDERTDE